MRVPFGQNSTLLSENVELYRTQHWVKYHRDRRLYGSQRDAFRYYRFCGIYGGNYTGNLFKSAFDITVFTEENLMLPKPSAISHVGMLAASFGLLVILALPARAQDGGSNTHPSPPAPILDSYPSPLPPVHATGSTAKPLVKHLPRFSAANV